MSTPLAVGETAALSRRFGALLVDWILCLLITFAFGVQLSTSGPIPVLVLIGEYTFFLGLFTQTPGMFVAGIRCVSLADGARIGVPRAFLRGLLLALVIPALIMRDGRGWHDRATGSLMVPAPRG